MSRVDIDRVNLQLLERCVLGRSTAKLNDGTVILIDAIVGDNGVSGVCLSGRNVGFESDVQRSLVTMGYSSGIRLPDILEVRP
jgi:hypothetical protein